MVAATEAPRVRLAEVVALLSLGTDLGLGQPMEHMIRACLLALRLADGLEFDDGERGTLYYSGLLAWVGCHTDAYEQAKWFGDDLALKRDAHYGYDFGRSSQAAAFMLKNIGGLRNAVSNDSDLSVALPAASTVLRATVSSSIECPKR